MFLLGPRRLHHVDAEHDGLDLVADLRHVVGAGAAVVRELRELHAALDAAEVDEEPVLAHRDHDALHLVADLQGLHGLGGALAHLALAQGAAGEHGLAAAVDHLGHAEQLALQGERLQLRGGVHPHVDLRGGAEAAHAADVELQAALVVAGDQRLDGLTRVEGLNDHLLRAVGAGRVAGDHQAAPAGAVLQHHHVDGVAHLRVGVVFGELAAVEHPALLAPEVGDDTVGADLDDLGAHLVAGLERAVHGLGARRLVVTPRTLGATALGTTALGARTLRALALGTRCIRLRRRGLRVGAVADVVPQRGLLGHAVARPDGVVVSVGGEVRRGDAVADVVVVVVVSALRRRRRGRRGLRRGGGRPRRRCRSADPGCSRRSRSCEVSVRGAARDGWGARAAPRGAAKRERVYATATMQMRRSRRGAPGEKSLRAAEVCLTGRGGAGYHFASIPT